MISETAHTNLGLLKYYFNGKEELGALIYNDIRTVFDQYITAAFPSFHEIDLFLASSSLELYLCLTNEAFGNFYFDLYHVSQIHNGITSHIHNIFKTETPYCNDPEYIALATLSITSIKPALVGHALSHPQIVASDHYLEYYLNQQMHYLGISPHPANFYISLLHEYYINIVDHFTPIFTKLLS